ncbi:hypothetical protein PMZ80_005858 [Knufia obscura]|uniref:C2H2-type domain-containing protein n=2 Tax=Knufia TaxID=430999 RepID=A0AAN8ERK0_9EURO|nr:hypothetical protein PMZ80_005858 [Knufia obscura]KAK5954525.1 hypothetical protein OHC33_004247 [Knufia fluminis]
MPRAEAGSTKAIANQLKSKGLQRLRWYCQACEKQCRDENGFKCHVASESHTKNMLALGEDPRRAINDFSNQFKRDFLQLLRTGHGEKWINANRFYNEYIANKEHVHMSATKWNSLTEFVKYLGREGICRVEVDEKGEERGGASALMLSWIDNSPEAMRRQEALKKRERQDRGDESREQRLIEAQIRKAREQARMAEREAEEEEEEQEDETAYTEGIKRADREKIKLNFGAKPPVVEKEPDLEKPPSPPLTDKSASPEDEGSGKELKSASATEAPAAAEIKPEPAKVSIKPMSLGASKPKNVFASAGKKNAFGAVKRAAPLQQQKPMSEAERIMKEEIERKRQRESHGGNAMKRQRVM